MEKDFDGKKYEKFSQPQRDWGSKVMEELELRGDEHILDLGCGNGLLTAKLAERVPDGRVVGVDSSASMLKQAEEHRAENMEFMLMDMETMVLEEKFDVVFSNAALHWVKDHSHLLKTIYENLRTGGFMRVQFAGEGNCRNLYDVLMKTISSSEFEKEFSSLEWPWYMPGTSEYEEQLLSAGFEQRKVWMEDADRNFPDEASFVGWIEQPGLVPFMPYLEEERTKLFRDTVVEDTKKRAAQPDGTYFEYFRRMNVYAVKK
ncbi:methyltransferase domain-containing protein [Methanolobus sp. WCC4]|uniref:methyltransferase domain-containing protein n=1 Tax=Methanolobus sp. WCC4 TaxID=3125784 RepID=UPI0030FC4364